MNEIEIQRKMLNVCIKHIIKRIKVVQQEKKDVYTQEDVWIKQGVEDELINLKISLEKLRKKISQNNNS